MKDERDPGASKRVHGKVESRIRGGIMALGLSALLVACGGPAPAPAAGPPRAAADGTAKQRGPATGPAAPAPVPDTAPALLQMFVMSKCPYAVMALDELQPVLEKLGDRVRLELEYIATEEESGFSSMHGADEVAGDLHQLCARELYPARKQWLGFIQCVNRNWRQIPQGWEACAEQAGMAPDKLRTCAGGDQGAGLLRASLQRARERGIAGSPTIVIAGTEYSGSRSERNLMRAVCGQLGAAPPAACTDVPLDAEVSLVVLSDRRCGEACRTERLEEMLRQRLFSRLSVAHLDYSAPEGRDLFKQLGLSRLPVFLFKAGVERAENYPQVARWMELRGTYRMLRSPASFDPTAEICDNKVDDTNNGKVDCDDPTCKETLGCRPVRPRHLSLFVMSMCPFGIKALDAMRDVLSSFGDEVSLDVHYIATEASGGFSALHGKPEVDENIRQLCARKYYSKKNKYLDYIWCRNKDIRLSNWRACATGEISAGRIASCAGGKEGRRLLSEDIRVAEALRISASPTWLSNNRRKFSGITAEAVRRNICRDNPGLEGCGRSLSGDSGAPAGGSCGGAASGAGDQEPQEGAERERAVGDEGDAEPYKVGVPECDQYIEKMLACIRGKMPEETRALLERSLKNTSAEWRAAATGQGRRALAEGCKTALTAAASSMKAYGCVF